MRLRDTIVCSICIALAISLLVIAGMRLDYINAQRKEMKLISNEPLENAPPSLAFATVAMGAFRGLVVDVLWMRADRLKEEGQFFDAKQLAEWISILQPRFATVWEFHAWNMAYNISVAIPATQPEQRWQWVKNGYELLRDKGIPLNPRSILLYRELARIFQHKIGDVADDAHEYYKLQLAEAMESAVGKPESTDNEYFKALAQAPAEWEQVIVDANIVPLITALKSAEPTFADDEEFVNNYLALRQKPKRFKDEAFQVINDFRGKEALKKFDLFAKAYYLRKTWKLDPVLMQQINQTYGPVDWQDPNLHLPLDWRHPDSHAIYWAVKGLQMASKEEYSAAETNTDRIVNHSLQNLFRNGKIFIYNVPSRAPSDSDVQISGSRGQTKEIYLRPDLRMFEPYNKSVLAIIDKYENASTGTYQSMKIGHRNMLKNAVSSFYLAGHIKLAQRIYNQLRKLYPRDEFKVSLVDYVRSRQRDELKSFGLNDAKEMIQMMLREGYFRYAVRDDDAAFNREKIAKDVFDLYQSLYSEKETQDRIGLPDFKLLKYFALSDFFSDEGYPLVLRQNLLRRIELERPELAEQLKQQEKQLLEEAQSTDEQQSGP